MAEKTPNFNLTKPPVSDFYDIEVHNDNMDIIDEELRSLNSRIDISNVMLSDFGVLIDETRIQGDDMHATLHSHLLETNPHGVTASTVGLGNVPNVATNDQTPTYTEASTLATLTSGEKLSVAFGKIKKAITDFIAHLADTTKHITSTERTSWNAKAPASHATTSSTYGLGTTANYGHCRVINSLYQASYADGQALAAYQGKVLNDAIAALSGEALRMEVGSYIGTGKYGSDNPCMLTFKNTPKLVMITGYKGNSGEVKNLTTDNSMNYYPTVDWRLLSDVYRTNAFGTYTNSGYTAAKVVGNTLYWWTASHDMGQFNGTGLTYYYIVLY